MEKKTVSFYRKYYSYTGGHQKVKDYIHHFIASNYQPLLFTEGEASTCPDLFKNLENVTFQEHYKPQDADIVMLAGMDWKAYMDSGAKHNNIFNLIQHVRHADRQLLLFEYLAKPAVRLCVSNSVKNAILPFANGPCHTINMGIYLPHLKNRKSSDLYILASKQPELGHEILEWANGKGIKTILHDAKKERIDVLSAMSSSRVTLALPNISEGFFLPSLEAMHYSNFAVVPYCIANNEYYHPCANLIIPDYEVDDIKSAILRALSSHHSVSTVKKYIGQRIVRKYSLKKEQQELQKILKLYV